MSPRVKKKKKEQKRKQGLSYYSTFTEAQQPGSNFKSWAAQDTPLHFETVFEQSTTEDLPRGSCDLEE